MYSFPNTYLIVGASQPVNKNHTICPANDAVFGCRDNYDLTLLLLEDMILSMIPSGMMVLLSVARILYLRGKPKLVISAKRLQLLKLVRGHDFDVDDLRN
jgi:hypothetical protein